MCHILLPFPLAGDLPVILNHGIALNQMHVHFPEKILPPRKNPVGFFQKPPHHRSGTGTRGVNGNDKFLQAAGFRGLQRLHQQHISIMFQSVQIGDIVNAVRIHLHFLPADKQPLQKFPVISPARILQNRFCRPVAFAGSRPPLFFALLPGHKKNGWFPTACQRSCVLFSLPPEPVGIHPDFPADLFDFFRASGLQPSLGRHRADLPIRGNLPVPAIPLPPSLPVNGADSHGIHRPLRRQITGQIPGLCQVVLSAFPQNMQKHTVAQSMQISAPQRFHALQKLLHQQIRRAEEEMPVRPPFRILSGRLPLQQRKSRGETGHAILQEIRHGLKDFPAKMFFQKFRICNFR